jgi:large conductance mechanosensitive channel
MLKEFKEFALRGNVIDLAVGVVIGAAFNAIVGSLVADIFMPIIGAATSGYSFAELGFTIGSTTIPYGKFVQAVFYFLLTAIALFMFVKAINRMKKKEEAKPAPVAEVPADVKLLIEIRDLLKRS